MNLPNKLTITRMVLTPVFVACFYIPVSWSMYLAGALFVIAYLTDMLDGQIALILPLATLFSREASSLAFAAEMILLLMSRTITAAPAVANAVAMSSPIVPAPITAILSSIIVRHSPLNSALGRFARKAVMALS